jgi:serine/threonine protein kinase
MSESPATGEPRAPTGMLPAGLPTVPGYEILEEVARGGMGVVYKARDLSLKRLVALKLLREGALATDQERYRFRIEAEAMARVHHANIVQIYEVGEHAGQPYFAMELVEGGSLNQYVAGQPQPASLAAELVRILALAVQQAHDQKVVHRDLKPANILLQRKSDIRTKSEIGSPKSEQEGGLVSDFGFRISDFDPKVTDFGLAKRLDSESTAWTQTGAVLGTASYMAPEQAAGRVREIGPAVDIYALGAILYELLTGRPPFQGDSWNQTVQQVLYDEPDPPRRLQPTVPHDLETVCLKCLEKEPDRRYATAKELADDLGRFLQGKGVVAVPLGNVERLTRLAGRDGYQMIGEVGRGPRSTVYHAVYGPLKQAVALKVFSAAPCTREEWDARLQRGADMWAGLAHPHLVPVQRAGWWDGAPYLALEYVPQGSLAALLAGQPYPIRQALRLVEQLAEIVGYLHRQGVVHGNLKPSNVLLAADGIPRLVDLHPTGGLFQGPLPTDDTDSAGLPYLAPELVVNAGADLRPYTDIYGLGAILYELLTGRPPFAGASAREVLEQVRSKDPLPPSRINSEVEPRLEALCLRCLRKNPWRRFSRTYVLITQLRDLQDNPTA